MDKQILNDYIDACQLIKETEADIRKLQKKKEVVHDSVKGSMNEFPYVGQTFRLCGSREEPQDRSELEREILLLEDRKENAKKIKLKAEAFLNTTPVRMQRIIRFKIFQKMSWDQVALNLGRNCTGDSVRMEFERFMKEN